MKKLWLIVAIFALISCKNEATTEYALISGKITNTNKVTIYGVSDRGFKEKLALAEDGSFKNTLKAGSYFFSHGRKRTPLYLSAGDNITLNFDAKNFKNTLTISGKGAGVNNYLVAKKNTEKKLIGEGTTVYTQGEVDYKKTFYGIKTAQKNLLNTAKGIDPEFKAKEERNIHYAYLEKLKIYKSYHSYYAKKKDFEPSKEFLSEFEKLTYDQEEDFLFSSAYKSLVTSHYKSKALEIAKETDKYATLAMLKVSGSIKNQTIKNALIHEASKYNITYTDDIERFYTAYKAAGSTNKKNKAEIEKSYIALRKLAKGNPSPKFLNYENHKGGTTSLDDLKGKYTYIDIWATWCGPCIAQIPYLKKVDKEFHGKNIQFLSISIDVKKDYQKWKDMVKEKELGGIQLFADNNWKSTFITDYLIKGIPKFILLDPQGNIVTANAPRPSDDELTALFKELKI